MTSNIGSQYLLDGIQDDGSISEEARNLVMQDLRAHFRPEFLNRLDETIMFKPLTKDNIGHIVDLLLKGLNKRLADQELTVELSPAAKQLRDFYPSLAEFCAAMQTEESDLREKLALIDYEYDEKTNQFV